jgi:hypothetical protein
MRAAALATLAGALALAGLAQGAPRPPLNASGLYGLVMRGPVTPVCQVGIPCDQPAANVTFLLVRSGKSTRVHTNATGHYRVRLAPGRYFIARTNWGPGSIKPESARVPYGRFARVNIFIDTGIR